MNYTHRTVKNALLYVGASAARDKDLIAASGRSHETCLCWKGWGWVRESGAEKAARKQLPVLVLIAVFGCASMPAWSAVTDHGNGDYTISGTFTPTEAYNFSNLDPDVNSSPTITVEASTNISGDVAGMFFVRSTGYTVNVEAGAYINNMTTGIFDTEFVELVTYHIAGTLESSSNIIHERAETWFHDDPSWDITLSGTLRNNSSGALIIGRTDPDKLTLESTGVLESNGGTSVIFGEDDDTFIINGGSLVNLGTIDLGGSSDVLELNATPTVIGDLTINGGAGNYDTVRLNNNSGSFPFESLSGWERIEKYGTSRSTLTADTNHSFDGMFRILEGQLCLDTAAGTTTTIGTASVVEGHLSFSGTLTKAGDGTLLLGGSNVGFDGAVYLIGGTLRPLNGYALPRNRPYVMAGGTLDLSGYDLSVSYLNGMQGSAITLGGATLTVETSEFDSVFGGIISGSGRLIKTGTEMLTLSGNNTFSGTTTVTAGILRGNSASLPGNIANNASVIFDQGTDGSYSDNMSGSGSLTKEGAGVLTLSGSNSYSGGTTVAAGTLQGDSISLQDDITNNDVVVFDQTVDGAYAGNMDGSGSLTKQGAGSLILSGSNNYTGITTISGGTLYVNGSIASAASVENSATLGGSGTVGEVTVNNGATLAPGNSPGELTTATLMLNDTSVLDFELGDPAGSAGVDSDLVTVNGDLTLDGTLNITTLSGFGVGIYRLFNYSGSLTDNTLNIGPLPTGFVAAIDTSVNGQVNLSVTRTVHALTLLDDGNGSLLCFPNPVTYGGSSSCSVAPDAGYSIASVSGCAGTLHSDTYTTSAITAECTITASFSLDTYPVMATTDGNGTINPASSNISHGSTAVFTVTPDTGYRIDTVSGCSGSLSGNSYTTAPITAACTVSATFTLSRYTITTLATDGGTISPQNILVEQGDSTVFTLTPAEGYTLAGVSGCGGHLAGNTYTTGAVTGDCQVRAQFAKPNTLILDGTQQTTQLDAGTPLDLYLDNGSGDYVIDAGTNQAGLSGELIDLGSGHFQFIAPNHGAFAGSYPVTVDDPASGLVQTLWIEVPLDLSLSRSTVLSEGPRNSIELTVRGAPAGSDVLLTLAVDEGGTFPFDTVHHLTASENEADGNPASVTLSAQPFDTTLLIEVSAQVAGLVEGRDAFTLLPATTLSGWLYNSTSGDLAGAEILLLSAIGDAELQPLTDELEELYLVTSDQQGRFTLYMPPLEEGENRDLLFVADGVSTRQLEANACLAGNGGCSVEMTTGTSSAPIDIPETTATENSGGGGDSGGGGILGLWMLLWLLVTAQHHHRRSERRSR